MRGFCATLLLLAVSKFSSGENCDKLGILVYEDMACTPSYDQKNACPTKYDCEGLTTSDQKCFFRGHAYKKGEPILNSPPCQWGCFCQADGSSNSSDFACAQFGCQDWGQSAQPGCYWGYALDKCCSTGQICSSQQATKCVVDGVEYKKGQAFWPKGSCYHCICDEGFTGKYEAPFCKRTECGVQIRNQYSTQKKCAPLYLQQSNLNSDIKCCPNRWICPDGTEQIKPSATPNHHSDAKCSFGTTSVNIGDYFVKEIVQNRFDRRTIRCECKIPPLLTCVEVPRVPS